MIHTITGEISCSELQHTQCHEHVFLKKGASFCVNPALCMDDPEKTDSELIDYAKAGGHCIVDAQPPFCGRMAASLVCASELSKVRIVASTGFHKKIFYDEGLFPHTASEDALTDFFIRELTKEMVADDDETPIPHKAGIIKMALEGDPFADKIYCRLFHACANASLETGAPILMHVEPNTDVLGTVDWFLKKRIPESNLIFCHMDRTHQDAAYHKETLDRGIFLCYDSVRREKYISREDHFALLCESLKDHEQQLLLSLDTTNQRLRCYCAKDMGLDYILTGYLPWLKSRGFSDDLVHTLMVENPRKALCWTK